MVKRKDGTVMKGFVWDQKHLQVKCYSDGYQYGVHQVIEPTPNLMISGKHPFTNVNEEARSCILIK